MDETPYSFYFEGESLENQYLTNWEYARQQLSFLDPIKHSFIILSLPNGNYVQCAGSKQELTVEARIFSSDNSHSHYRSGKGSLSRQEAVIRCNVGPIFIDASQVLTLQEAEQIMRHFVETGGLHPDYVVIKQTEGFEN